MALGVPILKHFRIAYYCIRQYPIGTSINAYYLAGKEILQRDFQSLRFNFVAI